MWFDVLIALAAAFVAAVIGYPLVPLFLRLVKAKESQKDVGAGTIGIRADESAPRATGSEDIEVLRGGLWIGIVERALIAGAIVLARPELLGIVVAVKGLGRFAEIKSSALAGERFIIGTFVSIAIASVCGVIGWAIVA